MPSQSETQSAFSGSLVDPLIGLPAFLISPKGSSAVKRFSIYRNNHVAGLIEALEKTFPVVRQLVGAEFFRAAASSYIHQHPPVSPVLLLYGESFGSHLDSIPSAGNVPYLGDMARFEWTRIHSLNAGDAAAIPLLNLSALSAHQLTHCTLDIHPSARLLSSRWPIGDIWSACLGEIADNAVDMRRPVQLLIARVDDDVLAWPLSKARYALIRALLGGKSLQTAILQATRCDPEFELATTLSFLFGNELVTGLGFESSDSAPTIRST